MLRRLVMMMFGVGMLVAGTQRAWAQDPGPCVVVDSTGQCAIKAVDPARPGGPKGPKRPAPVPRAAQPAEEKRPPVVYVPNDRGVLPVTVDPASLAPAKPPAVTPPSLARVAIEQLSLQPPRIRLSAPSDRGFVGVPVWLWSERGPTVTGPVTRTATAGATSVTATARLERIEWSMGPPGAVVSCAGPGTPWQGQDGLRRFGEQTGVAELADLSVIAKTAGHDGGALVDTLLARAEGLRDELLADEHTAANKASGRMSTPGALQVFLIAGWVLYPAVVALLAA